MQKYQLFLDKSYDKLLFLCFDIHMNSKVGVKPISCNFYSFNFVCIMSKEHLYEREDKTRKKQLYY